MAWKCLQVQPEGDVPGRRSLHRLVATGIRCETALEGSKRPRSACSAYLGRVRIGKEKLLDEPSCSPLRMHTQTHGNAPLAVQYETSRSLQKESSSSWIVNAAYFGLHLWSAAFWLPRQAKRKIISLLSPMAVFNTSFEHDLQCLATAIPRDLSDRQRLFWAIQNLSENSQCACR